jgi:hypothetical protein
MIPDQSSIGKFSRFGLRASLALARNRSGSKKTKQEEKIGEARALNTALRRG